MFIVTRPIALTANACPPSGRPLERRSRIVRMWLASTRTPSAQVPPNGSRSPRHQNSFCKSMAQHCCSDYLLKYVLLFLDQLAFVKENSIATRRPFTTSKPSRRTPKSFTKTPRSKRFWCRRRRCKLLIVQYIFLKSRYYPNLHL